ncbi:MAG: hypothetical protein RIQ93_1148 [Verrucomicrobiota bacterium]|jgi:rod shape-determining protein MreD
MSIRRTLILFLTLLVLWFVVSEVNHALTVWRVYVFLGGLFVAYAALTQPLRAGLAASLMAGFVCDANAPAEILGTHTLLFAAAHLTVFKVRDRVSRRDTASQVITALLINLALFFAFSVTQIGRSAAWPRLFADLLFSQVLLILVAPWFFAFQSRALVMGRVDRDSLA